MSTATRVNDAVAKETAANEASSSPAFLRDRLTWLAYLLYGFWSLAWGMFAPIMPFLRDELKLSYSVVGLHFSALAVGLLIAGCSGANIRARIPQSVAIWGGTASVAIATASIAIAFHEYWTILAAVVVGFGGSIAAQAIITGLADRFPEHRAVAISELVMINSIFAAVAPAVVAAVIGLNLSWKFSLLVPVAVLAIICWGTKCGAGTSWGVQPVRATTKEKLPTTYWFYFGIVFLTVAAEWSIAFWCPAYLEKVHQFSRADACTALSTFLFAILAGRVIGSRVAAVFETNNLLIAVIIIATIGFFLFWCAPIHLAVYAGLILVALGLSNCYPFALTAAIGIDPTKTSQATATMTIGTGSAILLAPLLLGIVADAAGIAPAYGIVGVLLLLAVGAAIGSAMIMRRSNNLSK